MESAKQSTALQKRTSLANKHWGLFFSNLPYRVMNLRSLRDTPAAIARAAEKSAETSELNALPTSSTDSK